MRPFCLASDDWRHSLVSMQAAGLTVLTCTFGEVSHRTKVRDLLPGAATRQNGLKGSLKIKADAAGKRKAAYHL